MEKTIIGFVPYTRRQIVLMPDGRELERQTVYMKHDSWEQLRDICIAQELGTSGVLALLIRKSHQEWCQ